MTSPHEDRKRVAVIGAGWAGCAAALRLAQQGSAVTVYEQARIPGGRARRVVVGGVPLDNGQHLLVGAYRECLQLIARAHDAGARGSVCRRLPLTLRPWGRQPAAIRLTAWDAPAPLHLAGALVAARGLDLAAKTALAKSLLRMSRHREAIPATASVAMWFRDLPQAAFDGILAPLCIAALNTLPADASARMFANVLGATLGGPRAHSDFVVPATDLTALLPEPALRRVVACGGELRLGTTARATTAGPAGVAIEAGGATETFAAAVIAVGPHQLAGALVGAVAALPPCHAALAMTAAFAYEPIVTVYLAFAERVSVPAPVMRLDDRPGQWLFEHSARRDGPATVLAVVISAHGAHDRMEQDVLAAAVEAQLRRLEPALPAVAWTRVIAERRATYACTPGLARPVAGRLAPGIYLAGDYTDAEFPATLEAAVRSGHTAADALLAGLAERRLEESQGE
jgi:squalene-associated FAD-dependent desaturase